MAPEEPAAAVGMPAVAGTWKARSSPAQGSLVLPEVLLRKANSQISGFLTGNR